MSSRPGPEYFRLGSLRLYHPDAELAARLVNGAGELAAYAKTLAWVGTEYFGLLGRDLGSLGVLIAVGVRPGRRTRLWVDPVDGEVPADLWDPFVGLLDGAGSGVRPEVTAPVAFALACLMGDGPRVAFPDVPAAWRQAAASAGRNLAVPDDVLDIVFPADDA